MKRFGIGILALVFIANVAIAQDAEVEETPVAKNYNDKTSVVHELGLNATFFINTFVSFNTVNPTVVSPYAFTYKYRKGRGAFRFGIGGAYRQEKDDDPGDTFKTTNGLVDVRVGGEFNTPIGKRWRTSVGGDAVVSYAASTSENGNSGQVVTTKLTGTGVGAGPVVGIDFMPSKRIKLGTETSVMFKQEWTTQESSFDTPGVPSTTQKASAMEIVFDLPTSLYLIIMF